MFGFKLQKFVICIVPLLGFGVSGFSAEKVEAPAESASAEEAPAPSKAEVRASRYSIHGGFGIIRAYKKTGKQGLGSSGIADVKVAYLTKALLPKNKELYATFRYFPFQISPTSDDSTQQFSGVVSAYAVGAEFQFLTLKKADFYASLEIGAYQAHLADLLPIASADRPIKSFGYLGVLGAEVRYTLYDKFCFGPRLNFGVGSLSFVSFLLGASFYF